MKIKPFFTKNILLKIISLIIAIILWVSYGRISGEKTITHIDIAPTFSNLAQGFEIVNQDIPSIRLRIQGNTSILKTISSASFGANIDLRAVQEPSDLDILVLPILDYPSQVEILEVNPSSLDISIDKTMTRNIPLYIDIDDIDNIPHGKRIKDVEIIPQFITVEGPQSLVEDVESLGIKPISLPRKDHNYSITVNGHLDIPPRSPLRWRSETRRVGVQIYFEDIFETREFRRVPIKVIPEDIKYTLAPQNFVDTRITGPVILLEQIQDALSEQAEANDQEMSYYAIIDVSNIEFTRNQRLEVTPELLYQDRFSDIRLNPRNITIIFNESYDDYIAGQN